MFRKTIVAAAAAALVSAGMLAMSASSASATYYGYGGGYGWGGGGSGIYLNFGYKPHQRYYKKKFYKQVRQNCRPIYKQVVVWKPYHGWVYKTVYAGKKCYW